MVGFLVGFPVLLSNAAIWLFFSFRSKESVASDHYWAAVGTSTGVARLRQYIKCSAKKLKHVIVCPQGTFYVKSDQSKLNLSAS